MKNEAKSYVLALDQGTTSTRAIIFDENGEIVASAQKEFPQVYPRPGWVEHNPRDITDTSVSVLRQVIAGCEKPQDIEAMGITNQRETVVAWNRETGEPLYNAIVWQCRRTADQCEKLTKEGYGEYIYQKTGLMPDAYFSATKIKWLTENVPVVAAAVKAGKACFGTVDSYLMFKLSGGKIFATDTTNASRTMLYNIHQKRYDPDLLKLFNIAEQTLPAVYPSGYEYGVTDKDILGYQIPIAAVAGDQQSALYGQRCFLKGQAKCTFGTGCFLLCNTGEDNIKSKNGLITTLASDESGKACYALEGSVFTGGAAVQWLRDGISLINSAAETEDIALSVPDSGGVFMVPAFVGLGAPYWDSSARGIICGITRGTTRAHIVRATLESIAYQCADVLSAMEQDIGKSFNRLSVDGGACANNFLMQFLADITGAQIVRPRIIETTAFGTAAIAAKVRGGKTAQMLYSPDFAERVFDPRISEHDRKQKLDKWHDSVARARSNKL